MVHRCRNDSQLIYLMAKGKVPMKKQPTKIIYTLWRFLCLSIVLACTQLFYGWSRLLTKPGLALKRHIARCLRLVSRKPSTDMPPIHALAWLALIQYCLFMNGALGCVDWLKTAPLKLSAQMQKAAKMSGDIIAILVLILCTTCAAADSKTILLNQSLFGDGRAVYRDADGKTAVAGTNSSGRTAFRNGFRAGYRLRHQPWEQDSLSQCQW